MTDQTGCLRIINNIGKAIPDTVDRFVNQVQRHEEPFLRPYRAAETVMDGEVELSWCKDTVDYPLQLRMVDTDQFVKEIGHADGHDLFCPVDRQIDPIRLTHKCGEMNRLIVCVKSNF